MNYPEYMIDVTQKAADEAFRYAVAVPEDKTEWKPSEGNRTVLEQTRELAKCPVWAYEIISAGKMPDFTEEARAAMKADMETLKTVAECQTECNQNLSKLFELYKTISDEKLKETIWLPFNGGRDHTVAEIMDYPRWNFNYHLGQVAYIQMMYGDGNMY